VLLAAGSSKYDYGGSQAVLVPLSTHFCAALLAAGVLVAAGSSDYDYGGSQAGDQLEGECSPVLMMTNQLQYQPTVIPTSCSASAGFLAAAGSSNYDYGGSQAGDQLEGECSPVLMMTNLLHHHPQYL
jgi:hypothetical protein